MTLQGEALKAAIGNIKVAQLGCKDGTGWMTAAAGGPDITRLTDGLGSNDPSDPTPAV